MEALRQCEKDIRFIQVRHEEAAAFMACAYAKYTGKLGVCLATSGPGGIHLLNGLYDAKMDGEPVLEISGHHYHDLIETHAQQEVDLDRAFMDVTVYNTRGDQTSVPHCVELSRWLRTLTFRSIYRSTRSKSIPNVIYPGHTSNVFAVRSGL